MLPIRRVVRIFLMFYWSQRTNLPSTKRMSSLPRKLKRFRLDRRTVDSMNFCGRRRTIISVDSFRRSPQMDSRINYSRNLRNLLRRYLFLPRQRRLRPHRLQSRLQFCLLIRLLAEYFPPLVHVLQQHRHPRVDVADDLQSPSSPRICHNDSYNFKLFDIRRIPYIHS